MWYYFGLELEYVRVGVKFRVGLILSVKLTLTTVALLGMVATGAEFRVSPLFGPKKVKTKKKKKGHCRQSSGFSAQKYVNSKTKRKKGLRR